MEVANHTSHLDALVLWSSLPGEIRELVNKVVEAERTAKANLIRRQEETAATRSLLNTARLMEDNPLLLRMKELEALEKLVDARMLAGNQPQGTQAATAGDPRTREDLRKMMMDPRYRDPYRRDPAFVREVGNLQQRLYATGA